MPRLAICRAICSGSLPSGEPSSKPTRGVKNSSKYYLKRRTVAVLSYAMRRRIRDEHHHLACVRSPAHIESFRECSSDRLRSITTARCVQAREVTMNLRDIRGEAEVLCHIGVVLRWMVPVGDESDAQIISTLEPPRLVDVVTDLLDISCGGGYVAALAPRTVLYEHQVADGR